MATRNEPERRTAPRRRREPRPYRTRRETVTERTKKDTTKPHKTTRGNPAMSPDNYPNAEAVFTTGPGEAVTYQYTRQGTYSDEYAAQPDLARYQSQEKAPPTGPGQEGTYPGRENNPT